MIIVNIPRWLAKSEGLPQVLEGEVKAETTRGILFEGTALVAPTSTCYRCGKTLTHPVSLLVGYGPECCGLLGIERPNLNDAVELTQQIRTATVVSRWFPKSQIEIVGEYSLPQPVKKRSSLRLDGKNLRVSCDYTDREKVKSVPGYAWNGTDKTWDFPGNRLTAKALIDIFGEELEVSSDVLTLVADPKPIEGFPDGLFPFQVEGAKFLYNAKRALLGDDMGLGKTIQAIAVCLVNGSKTILVLCPNSLKWNWEREFKKWAPKLTVQVIHGDAPTRAAQFDSPSIVKIVNLELLRLKSSDDSGQRAWSFEVVKCLSKTWDTLIIDEAHRIKNRDAQVTKASWEISKKAENLLLLTGTPITNRPNELWSLLKTLYPKQFSSYWRFVNEFCIVSHNGYGFEVGRLRPEKAATLKQLLTPMCIRRLKMSVLTHLPQKTVQQVWVDLEGEQKKVYDQMAETAWAQISESQEVSAAVVLAQITRLKQITVDPQLTVNGEKPLSGKKVETLLEILESSGDQKVVIFSQFARAIEGLSKRLALEKLSHVLITGQVGSLERQEAIDKFQTDPACKIFLATTRVGGTGLNLTAGSIVVFLDKAWTPAENLQAQDRLHRYGQSLPVTVIELLARDTIEEKIEDLLESKNQDFRTIFDQDEVETGSIKRASLLTLLQKRESVESS